MAAWFPILWPHGVNRKLFSGLWDLKEAFWHQCSPWPRVHHEPWGAVLQILTGEQYTSKTNHPSSQLRNPDGSKMTVLIFKKSGKHRVKWQTLTALSFLWLTSNWKLQWVFAPTYSLRTPFLNVRCRKTSIPQEQFMLYLFPWNLLPPGSRATFPQG